MLGSMQATKGPVEGLQGGPMEAPVAGPAGGPIEGPMELPIEGPTTVFWRFVSIPGASESELSELSFFLFFQLFEDLETPCCCFLSSSACLIRSIALSRKNATGQYFYIKKYKIGNAVGCVGGEVFAMLCNPWQCFALFIGFSQLP